MAIKIDKNVPVPEKMDSKSRYPWREMEVGDSFVVTNSTYGSVRQLVSQRNRWSEAQYQVAKKGDEIRCWRIS